MWYVGDVLYVCLCFNCFVVRGCAVSRRYVNVCILEVVVDSLILTVRSLTYSQIHNMLAIFLLRNIITSHETANLGSKQSHYS